MDGARLLDEVRAIAVEGLTYADSPFDRDRYERLLAVAASAYAELSDLDPVEVSDRFRRDLGCATPKLGAEALIEDGDGRLLVCERLDGTWCMPCGWVDPNEGPSQAAVRETREETGLEVVAVRLAGLHLLPARLPHAPHGSLHATVRCSVVSGTLRPLEHEVRRVAWCRLADVPLWHGEHEAWLREALRAAAPGG